MPGFISLPIKETNLLRSRLQNLMKLRAAYLESPQEETIHDLRVASRRAREVLDYFQQLLTFKWYDRLMSLSRRVTKSMGRLRETEVNLGLLSQWLREDKMNPIASEMLTFSQQQQFERLNAKARNRVGDDSFSQIPKFLSRLHGARLMQAGDSTILERRNQEFLSFSWEGMMDDERLHDLRIRTKTFRYAVEIYDRLHSHNLGHFARRIRNLQDLLGQIHDLYVLAELIRKERDAWDASGLTLIPRAFDDAYKLVISEKAKLYPKVLPLYTRVLENSPLVHVGIPIATAV